MARKSKRAPFRLPEKIVTLFFEDGPYRGLELDVNLRVPMGVWFGFTKLEELVDDDVIADLRRLTADQSNTEQERAAARRKVDALEKAQTDEIRAVFMGWAAAQLRGWNLEDATGPVPATPDAFCDRLDKETHRLILSRWRQAVAGLSVPLASPSPSGDTSAGS